MATIEPPLVVESADAIDWDDAADVVVVGFGGAGACAAIEAAERGADVVAIDRYAGGGATARSGGVIYAGATHVQREAGVSDSADEMAKYLGFKLNAPADPVIRAYADDSAENLRWLAGHGVPFKPTLFEEKADYPPEEHFLYYAGTEKRADAAAVAKPAPRGHRVVGAGLTGTFYHAALRAQAAKLGVRFRANSPARRLIQDRAGTIVGVEFSAVAPELAPRRQKLYDAIGIRPFLMNKARKTIARMREMEDRAPTRRVRARGGVVIATGGFGYNERLIREYTPKVAANNETIIRMGALGCDGSGIELGLSAGADVGAMDKTMVAQTVGTNFLRDGILVNRDGARFVPEDGYNGEIGAAVLAQPGSAAWLVIDRGPFLRALRDCAKVPIGPAFMIQFASLLRMVITSKSARSLPKLAAKCGMDPARLAESVRGYNASIDSGAADPLGKAAEFLHGVRGPAYHAINYSTGSPWSFVMLLTLGGLRVSNDTGAVIGKDGRPIAGLYAAGRAAMGLSSHDYVSGLSLGDGLFFGRLAGRNAAARSQTRNTPAPAKQAAVAG